MGKFNQISAVPNIACAIVVTACATALQPPAQFASAAAGGKDCSAANSNPSGCHGAPEFDTHAIYASPYDGNQLVEFVTSSYKYSKYNLATGTLIASGSIGDSNTPAWASVDGQFDTRAVYVSNWDGNQQIEFITTDTGKYYKFALATRTLLGSGVSGQGASSRWSAPTGPCQSGVVCRMDTRVVYTSQWDGNQQVEFITKGNRYWKYLTATNGLVVSGTLGDSNTSRWLTNGPCTAVALTQCWIDTRTVYTRDAVQYEVVTVSGKWWQYRLSDGVIVGSGSLQAGRLKALP